MSALPRVAESTRQQITREFDDAGPDACIAEISAHLREHNPEWLNMAAKCAGDVGDPPRIMGGFCMFYRLLIAQAATSHPMMIESDAPAELNPLPHFTAETRAAIVAAIDKNGAETLIKDALQKLGGGNPELLQMAHYFASAQDNYLDIMQGLHLLNTALLLKPGADRKS